MISSPLKQGLCGALLLAACLMARAGSIELTPVRVNLSSAVKVAVLTVRNTGTEESVMQVTLNRWTLGGEGYVYQRSQELVVTPQTFRLAPGAQQIVRIGLRAGVPPVREESYRLLVEEVPLPPSPDVTQAQLVVRHDLPVFVAPLQAAKPALDVAVECAAAGATLRVTNIGNVHAQLRNLALNGAPANVFLGSWDTFDYLLPDAQKTWGLSLVAPQALGRSFVLTAVTDQGSFTADVANKCT